MKRTTIMADEELLYRIERVARNRGQTKSQVVREALEAYVTTAESEEPPANPLLNLIGLAGDDAVAMDLADGDDEEMIRQSMHPKYGFTRSDDENPG